jgi:ribosomal protein S20
MKHISKKALTGLVMGMFALSMMFGLAFSSLSASAAPASQTTPTTPTTPGTQTTPPARTGMSALAAALKKNFAAALGVDEAKLNSAYTSAITTTVDQAVAAGTLTQEQADRIKAAAANGFPAHLGGGKGRGGFGDHRGIGGGATTEAAAKTLNMTLAELKTELQAGKTIAAVAAAKNVQVQTVKDAMLAAVKTSLDQQVTDGKLTQAQADAAYQAAPARIDQQINNTRPAR